MNDQIGRVHFGKNTIRAFKDIFSFFIRKSETGNVEFFSTFFVGTFDDVFFSFLRIQPKSWIVDTQTLSLRLLVQLIGKRVISIYWINQRTVYLSCLLEIRKLREIHGLRLHHVVLDIELRLENKGLLVWLELLLIA